MLLEGRVAAAVVQDGRGRLSLTYEDSWREWEDAYPVSLSMPLARASHGDEVLRSFLQGLLPDNTEILERWASRFSVSARNPFALLTHVGQDCAGAVQLVPPDHIDAVLRQRGSIQWLSEEDIASRLARLRRDRSAWRNPEDLGAFSLAGAQAKTALHSADGRWGVPTGAVPTTHILKPPLSEFEGFVENEHLTLELANHCGLTAARSRVVTFGDEIAVVVERFDRVVVDGELRRVHQEDLCQALGTPPTRKYEAEGGPGVAELIGVLRDYSSDAPGDVSRIAEAMIFSWLVGVTDGHAKNYSVMLAAQGLVALSPLYDLASAAPYPLQVPWQKMKLAMKLGGEYRMRWIRERHLNRLGESADYETGELPVRARELGRLILEHLPVVEERGVRDGLDEASVATWSSSVADHVERCLHAL